MTLFCPGQCLLILPHQLFPLLHLWTVALYPGLLLKRKPLVALQDHYQPRTPQVKFQVENARLSQTIGNRRPHGLVMSPGLADQVRVVR